MSYHIPVFKAEIDAGIAEQVRTTASIAYCTKVEHSTLDDKWMEKVCASIASKAMEKALGKVLASLSDGDLYPAKSILASTCWNKNDDVFHPVPTWAARRTPVHKPDNLNHNELIIVGHMIDTWAISAEGTIISDDIADDDIPDFFHLVNNSVIYRNWADDERRKSIAELIEKIEAGEAFVSMECLFRGFDYAITTPEGEQKIIARNKETAFLTKHLRGFGGEGVYDNYKVGRLLRNITFSGKGYVNRPANPASIVFTKDDELKFSAKSEINTFLKDSGVLCTSKADTQENKEISNMADDTKVLADQITELKAAVASLTKENKELAEKSTQAAVTKLEASVADLTAKLEAAAAASAKAEKDLAAEKTAHAELVTKSEATATATAALEAELATIKAEAIKVARISALVEGGVSKESATATVEQFISLTDAQFKVIADLAIAAFPPKKDEEKKDDKKKDKSKGSNKSVEHDAAEGSADTSLEDAEVEKGLALAAAGEGDDEGDETRSALASWLDTRIGKGKNKVGSSK